MILPKPRVLIIDENLSHPADAQKYLGKLLNRVNTNGISEYESLSRLVEEGLSSYDLVITTPSFITLRGENIWIEILPQFFNTTHCPRIIMVSNRKGFKRSLAGISDRLFFANTPHRAFQLVGGMLF